MMEDRPQFDDAIERIEEEEALADVAALRVDHGEEQMTAREAGLEGDGAGFAGAEHARGDGNQVGAVFDDGVHRAAVRAQGDDASEGRVETGAVEANLAGGGGDVGAGGEGWNRHGDERRAVHGNEHDAVEACGDDPAAGEIAHPGEIGAGGGHGASPGRHRMKERLPGRRGEKPEGAVRAAPQILGGEPLGHRERPGDRRFGGEREAAEGGFEEVALRTEA